MINIKEQLNGLRQMYGTFTKKQCDEESSKKYTQIVTQNHSYENLPHNIKCVLSMGTHKFYSLTSELTENEIFEFIGYKIIFLLTTIKKCIMFFTICSIIGIILYLLYFILMIF